LKGGYLQQIIVKIEEHMGKESAMVLVLEEMLEMFKKLLKQLQLTQKELNKFQKEVIPR